MAVALEQFVKQLADSGVIAPGKLENFVPPKAQPKDAQELARQLVQSKQLTKFQVQEIYQGRAKSLILGNYTILDKIGAGGMGQVFKAEHRRMHRVVAIKMLPQNVTKDAAAIARFQREVEAAAKLEHPNIVTAHDADEAGGVHFLVMHYVDGSDLSALVKKNGPFPVDKAVSYILQAARGLEFAHGEGVVHRDIKPANLLLDKKGTVKILDMGLARISGGDDAATQAELTGTGAVLGTVDYMAPEQALSTKHADARADIYSLGCSLHYLIAGHATYDGDSLMAKLLAHREQPIPSLGADVPEEIQAIFEKMVAKKIEDRYQTMSEVVADLQECVAAGSTVGNSRTTVEPSPNDSNLSFLVEATAHTQQHGSTKQTKQLKNEAKPAKKATGWNRKQRMLIGGGLLGALILLAGVLVELRTKEGTLVVEVNQSNAVVQVLDAEGKVEISQPGGNGPISISVDPGKHRLKVEKAGFQFFATDFAMESGGTTSIKATLLEDKPWFKPAFLEWQKKVAGLPAEQQVAAVAKKLQELNPSFDGKLRGPGWDDAPTIEYGIVTGLRFNNDNVADISPLRALVGLKVLQCNGTDVGNGQLSDLSPLKGMSLTDLNCGFMQVSDLSPLQGMRLIQLNCDGDPVDDLSPLDGMSLSSIAFKPKNVTKGIGILRRMKSLAKISPGSGIRDLPPEEFWKKYDAGEFGKPIPTFKDPAFQAWMKTVAAKPAEQQVAAVAKKLQELNPGFDGKETHTIENGAVIKLEFAADDVTDLSPVRALLGLKVLNCSGSGLGKGKLSDLSPLQGMRLERLECWMTPISDLSPLEGMPLTYLDCGGSPVSDLAALKGMPLTELVCGHSPVSDLSPLHDMHLTTLCCDYTKIGDLSPLKEMPLTVLLCENTPVSDLTPLKEMNLTKLAFTPQSITKGMEVIRQIKSLTRIGVGWGDKDQFPPAEFWQKYDAGEFGRPDSTAAAAVGKPITTFNDPAFQIWMKTVTTLPAENQVDAVVKKLRELNPGFDGKETHKIENGVVTELQFAADNIVDLSAVRALTGLRRLSCFGSKYQARGQKAGLSDLSPLKGMRLTALDCGWSQVSDLSPLQAMPLEELLCGGTRISDLSPLRGMKLSEVQFWETNVIDMSPLQGMPLKSIQCRDTNVSDLSPLDGMDLTTICFTAKSITKGFDVLRKMKNLQFIEMSFGHSVAPDELWRRYDAGEFGKPLADFNSPTFQAWMKTVSAQPAEKQVDAVVKKLQQLNPGFDGKEWHRIENGVVKAFSFSSRNVADISPVRALTGLTGLICGSDTGSGQVSDLSPLQGMQLTVLHCHGTLVADLTPLKGMPLKDLWFFSTPVSDLSPLEGMPLTNLDCSNTQVSSLSPLHGMRLTELNCNRIRVSDLSPLKGMPLTLLVIDQSPVADLSALEGMPLTDLKCQDTKVSDLSPLHGMNLNEVLFTPNRIAKGIDVIRRMTSLKTIGISWDAKEKFTPVEFWKKFDAGEFTIAR